MGSNGEENSITREQYNYAHINCMYEKQCLDCVYKNFRSNSIRSTETVTVHRDPTL